jgi:hypothetical protein
MYSNPYDKVVMTAAQMKFSPFYNFAYGNEVLLTGEGQSGFFGPFDGTRPGLENVALNYTKKRNFIEANVALEIVRTLKPGQVGTLNFDRYWNAQKGMLVRKTRRLLSPVVSCLFWG